MKIAAHPEYVRWNAILLDYAGEFGVDADGRFFLVVRQMLEEAEVERALSAEKLFLEAVRNEYASRLSGLGDPLGALHGRRDADGRPLCAALLGAFVMAAEEMVDNAYYDHLARLMGRSRAGATIEGFVGESFERCWDELDRYLSGISCYLAKPVGGMRYVKWPRMHALLRAGDVEKIPTFFKWAGLSPTQSVSENRMRARFGAWLASPYCSFTSAGKKASEDVVRGPAILRQVIRIFDEWDGALRLTPRTGIKVGGGRSRACIVRICADIRPATHEPVLSLRAERKAGSPQTFQIGGVRLAALRNEDPFYEDAPLPALWSKLVLREGAFTVESGQKFALKGAEAFALCMTDDTGDYESRDALLAGVTCAVICSQSVVPGLERHIRNITGKSSIPTHVDLSRSLPGWRLYHGFVPGRALPAPIGLDNLGVEDRLTIRPIGGLRLGRLREWIKGAPPRFIAVHGVAPPHTASINGNDFQTSLPAARLFDSAGAYVLRADRFDYKMSIVEPQVSSSITWGENDIFGELYPESEENFDFCSDPEEAIRRLLEAGRAYYVGSNAGAISPASEGAVPDWARWLVVTHDGSTTVVAVKPAGADGARTNRATSSNAVKAWSNVATLVLRAISCGRCKVGALSTARAQSEGDEETFGNVRSEWVLMARSGNNLLRRSKGAGHTQEDSIELNS